MPEFGDRLVTTPRQRMRGWQIRYAADRDGAAALELFDRTPGISQSQVGPAENRARVVQAGIHIQRRMELRNGVVVAAPVVIDHADVRAEDRGERLDHLSATNRYQRIVDLALCAPS